MESASAVESASASISDLEVGSGLGPSSGTEWVAVSGRGTVTTWVVFHRKYFEAFAADLPYHVVRVQLDEGPRLTANLVGVRNDEIRVGMAVEVVFDDVTPEITLPRFRRV